MINYWVFFPLLFFKNEKPEAVIWAQMPSNSFAACLFHSDSPLTPFLPGACVLLLEQLQTTVWWRKNERSALPMLSMGIKLTVSYMEYLDYSSHILVPRVLLSLLVWLIACKCTAALLLMQSVVCFFFLSQTQKELSTSEQHFENLYWALDVFFFWIVSALNQWSWRNEDKLEVETEQWDFIFCFQL